MAANKSKVLPLTRHDVSVLSVLAQLETIMEHFCPRRTEIASVAKHPADTSAAV